MTKDEVETLLRHGAYNFLVEEENGESERVSADFCEEDIDSILKSRTKRVLGEKEVYLIGSTLSKVNFKTTKSDSNNTEILSNIDVDDPDFWSKIIDSNGELRRNNDSQSETTNSKELGRGENGGDVEPLTSNPTSYTRNLIQRGKRVDYSEENYFDNLLGTFEDTKAESEVP
jgi:hypothetical protein